jgi:hypothetical protein
MQSFRSRGLLCLVGSFAVGLLTASSSAMQTPAAQSAQPNIIMYLADPTEKHPLSDSERSTEARTAVQTLKEAMTMEAEVKASDSRRADIPARGGRRGSGGQGPR